MKIKGGIKLCSCGVLKQKCKKHSPINYCKCGKLIAKCKKCFVHIGRCSCGKRRGLCAIHGGWCLCVCGSGHHHSRCTVCGTGNKLCEHKKRYNNCMICLRAMKNSGQKSQYLSVKSEICPCGIARKHCNNTACGGGSHLCVNCKLTITRRKQTDCSVCLRFKNGTGPIKQKENALKMFLDAQIAKKLIPKYTLYDKVVEPGLDKSLFGNNRPDFVWRLPDRSIFLELDENQHQNHTYNCERRRELELCNISGEIPVYFIRMNPDSFSTATKSSRVKVADESIELRHKAVLEKLKEAFKKSDPSGLTFVRLFFNCKCVEFCGYTHTEFYPDHENFLKAFQ
jgi:hypothetical protein